MKKNYLESGITLVTLVITIVVMIILAGISINLTIGENGIITKAKLAKEKTELEQSKEQTALKELYDELEKQDGTIDKLLQYKQIIAKAITEQNVETNSEDSTETMVENIGKILKARTSDATATEKEISEGKIAYINGEEVTGTGENYNVIDLKGRYYIYKEGNIYSDITGGWQKTYGSSTGTITEESNYLGLKSTSICDFTTKNIIDFKGYSQLYIEYQIEGSINNTCMAVANTTNTSFQVTRSDALGTPIVINTKYRYKTLENGHYLVNIKLGNTNKGYITIEPNSNTVKVTSIYLR